MLPLSLTAVRLWQRMVVRVPFLTRLLLGAGVILFSLTGAARFTPVASAQSSGVATAPGGPFLVDAQGRRLELHGVNLVAKCAAGTHASTAPGAPCLPGGGGNELGYVLSPSASDPGLRFTAGDAATLHALGLSVVRLGIIWAGLEPGPPGAHADDPAYCSPHVAGTPFPPLGTADPYSPARIDSYLGEVDTIVALLARQHIRVLLDMHQDGWGLPFANPVSATPWMSEGAPAWATCTSGLPFGDPASWQSAYTDPAVNSAFEHFWANDVTGNLQEQYIRVLTAVAQHFAGNPDVLGYELFNEPSGPVAVSPPAFDRQLQCFYAGARYAPLSCGLAAGPSQAPQEGAIPSVLAADPSHLVFYEAPVLTDYGAPETVGIAEPLPFGHLVLSFHDYGGTPGASSFACTQATCSTQEQNTVSLFTSERAATQTSQNGGPAWLLSEFGAEPYVPDIANVTRLADRNLLSWIYWAGFQLHDPTGGPDEGLLDELTRRPDPARADVLARTYPLATAGTPLTQSFDPGTGAFAFTYRADDRVHSPTQIIVPIAYHYPHGYGVSVRGARVTSRPDAQLLTLVNDPGASTVTVALVARWRSHGARHLASRRHRHRSRPAPAFTG